MGTELKGTTREALPKLALAFANLRRAPRAPKDASAANALLAPKRSGRAVAHG